MSSPSEESGLKEARYAENNIIGSDSTIHKILTYQLNKMNSQYKVMCGCECCIYTTSIQLSLLKWRKSRLKDLKDRSHNAKNRRSGEISSPNFETYKNSV